MDLSYEFQVWVHIVINIKFGVIAKEKTLRQRTNDRRLATIGHRTTFNYEFSFPRGFFPLAETIILGGGGMYNSAYGLNRQMDNKKISVEKGPNETQPKTKDCIKHCTENSRFSKTNLTNNRG